MVILDNNQEGQLTQIVTLRRFDDKSYGYYMLIPNAITDNKKDEQRRFWVRIFASEQIDIV